ncbi:MAG TPA: hypothetical protein VEH49_07695 [Methylomirabilota bacterium]|nr:hypothetical protein [Methylomirabilota bacterium]
MGKHTLLRAYLAGICVPTIFLLVVVMPGYVLLREVYHFSIPVERVIVFPMAIVPNLWGFWNVLYVAFLAKRRFPIGLYGDALIFILAPLGFLFARILDLATAQHFVFSVGPVVLPVGLTLYYLAWKYLVGFLNAELGLANV